MFRGNSFKLFLITCCVILSSAASFFMPSLTAGQDLPFSEVEEKLAGLTGEEAETLEILFSLVQEIENMEKEQEELAAEMIVMEREIYHLESRIKIEEKLYNHKRSGLRQELPEDGGSNLPGNNPGCRQPGNFFEKVKYLERPGPEYR